MKKLYRATFFKGNIKTKYSILFLFFTTFFLQAQYKISGTLESEDKKLTWAMLYQIKDGRQHYIKNTKIKNKKFEFEIPNTSEMGMYRVVYRTKENGFVDFLFNKENVDFTFQPDFPEDTSVFSTSEENKLYQSYLGTIIAQQQSLDSVQVSYFRNPDEKSAKAYSHILKELKNTQDHYEHLSENKLAYHFIKATRRYNAKNLIKSPQEYLEKVKKHFFKHIDFTNGILVNSSFLVDRVTDYVFYLNHSKNEETQRNLYKESISNVLKQPMSSITKKDLTEILIKEFVKKEDSKMVNYLLETYYDTLPKELQKEGYKEKTLAKMTVVVGAVAPEIEWLEDKKILRLSELKDHKYYVVVFWSTGCSHCRKQVPEVYRYLKNRKDIQVVAFALEDNSKEWKKVIEELPGWHHALGLEKWENKTARTYNVSGTPSYFILDKDKVILNKPRNFRKLVKVVSKLK